MAWILPFLYNPARLLSVLGEANNMQTFVDFIQGFLGLGATVILTCSHYYFRAIFWTKDR